MTRSIWPNLPVAVDRPLGRMIVEDPRHLMTRVLHDPGRPAYDGKARRSAVADS
jgi:hypothetical protein